VRTLVIKELLAVWRDPRGRVVLFMPPLVQLTIFAFAATQEVKNVPVAVLNNDAGTASRDLLARFEGSRNFSKITYLRNQREIETAINTRTALAIIHLQSDFSRRVETGEGADVQLILDGRRSNAAQIVAGYSAAIVGDYNQELSSTKPNALPPPSIVVSRMWFNPNQVVTWNTVPSLVAVLTTLMGLLVTALSVARERELGTFEQLLVSPLEPYEIILGKTIPALLIGMGEATGMILLGVFLFRVPFHGSVLVLYGSMLIYLVAVIGVGLFISSLAKTQQQAILGAFAFMIPAILLSGFASPVENMPEWLQTVTLANPIRYFIIIVKGVFLKSLPVSVVFENLWPMAVIGAITLSSATWLFRHRME
jgi:ABC-2 type transport system permease protein